MMEDADKSPGKAKRGKSVKYSRGSEDTDEFSAAQPLSRTIIKEWEVINSTKSSLLEIHRLFEKLVRDSNTVVEDYRELSVCLSSYGKRLHQFDYKDLGQCVEQVASMNKQICDFFASLSSTLTQQNYMRLKEYLDGEYSVIREKKRRFDKQRVSFDTAHIKLKNLQQAKKLNQKKIDEATKEKDANQEQFLQIGRDTLLCAEEMNKSSEITFFENGIKWMEGYKEYFNKGNVFCQKMDSILQDWSDLLVSRKKDLENVKKERSIKEATGEMPKLVFEVPLEKLVARENRDSKVPLLVESSIQWIETHALEVEGIFRVSGFKNKLEQLKSSFEQGEPIDFEKLDLQVKDAHVVTGILKMFLRCLPEPVIPFSKHLKFIESVMITDKQEKVKVMQELIDDMPEVHALLLKKLLSHCRVIISKEQHNKMGIRNLAMVLSPTILYPKEPRVLSMLEDMERATAAIAFLIEHFEYFRFTPAEALPPPPPSTPATSDDASSSSSTGATSPPSASPSPTSATSMAPRRALSTMDIIKAQKRPANGIVTDSSQLAEKRKALKPTAKVISAPVVTPPTNNNTATSAPPPTTQKLPKQVSILSTASSPATSDDKAAAAKTAPPSTAATPTPAPAPIATDDSTDSNNDKVEEEERPPTPPPSQQNEAMLTTPPINIRKVIDSVFKFVLSVVKGKKGEELAVDLKEVLVTLRDINGILKNYPDSTLLSLFREIQEKVAKIVSKVKLLSEAPNDKDAQLALHSASQVLIVSTAKLMYAFEDIRDGEDIENIVASTQQAANIVSQLLRSIYSGSWESIGTLSSSLQSHCESLIGTITDRLYCLCEEKRLTAENGCVEVQTLTKELSDHCKKINTYADQSEVENQKNTIVAITKKLVLCYRTITGLYEDPLKSSNTEQVLKRAHAILSDSIRKFAPKHSSASSQKILDNVKQISIFFEQLAKDFNTAQGDESKQKEQVVFLKKIINCIHVIENTIQTDTDEVILANLTGTFDQSKQSIISSGIKLHSQLSAVRRLHGYIIINSSALCLSFDLSTKFEDRIKLDSTLYEIGVILAQILSQYALL